MRPSAICTARLPSGRPGNFCLLSVLWLITSSRTSARMRRIDAWLKFFSSSALVSFVAVASW